MFLRCVTIKCGPQRAPPQADSITRVHELLRRMSGGWCIYMEERRVLGCGCQLKKPCCDWMPAAVTRGDGRMPFMLCCDMAVLIMLGSTFHTRLTRPLAHRMDAAVPVLELVLKSLCARDLCTLGLTCKRVHSIVAAEHRAVCEDFARRREAVPVRLIWYNPLFGNSCSM